MSTFDAVVVGAGFGGIFNLYKLKELGLSVKCFEKAPEVGGTWYWSQYPGATSDSSSEVYRFSFDKELLKTYPWPTHFLPQKETQAYLKHVVELYDLGQHIQLSTELKGASFDAATSTWTVNFSNGETYKTTYLILACGSFHTPNRPKIPGLDKFAGPVYHTGDWPEKRDLKGKRVGVIGTGSSGAQVLVNIADEVKHLVSFQRSAQHVVPHPNGPVSDEYREWVNNNYDDIWEQVNNHPVGHPLVHKTTPTMSVNAEERERIWEDLWNNGPNGFSFMYGPFGDIHSSAEANREICKFFEKKIAQSITNPDKLKKLTPSEIYGKRPVTLSGYYETFNKENVDIVNYEHTPFVTINEKGILTEEKQWDLDVIILATGYEVIDGSYIKLDLQGTHGTLKENWAKEGIPTSYLGVSESGFPNMFFIVGPQSPFTNMPPLIESQGNFITGLIEKAEAKKKENGGKTILIEAEEKAKREWMEKCRTLAEGSLFRTVKSYIFGNMAPGKDLPGIFWLGGYGYYRSTIKEVSDNGYPGFSFST
ncbi:FAD/NAD(P)-binding domain-containing protein [Trichoderma evansii]